MTDETATISWLDGLRDGDDQAASKLWDEYFSRLLALTRQKLCTSTRTMADEEDIVVSAIKSFCVGMRAGRFSELAGRDSLWRLLLTITFRKIADKYQYDRRGKRDVTRLKRKSNSDSLADSELNEMISREPDPQTAAECADQLHLLLDALERDDLKQVALLKMEGFTNAEIAQEFTCSLSSVERKLRTIRSIWSGE